MTKVSVFGQENEVKKDLKKIEFVKRASTLGEFVDSTSRPSRWSNIMLLQKNYTVNGLDIIMAWDEIDRKFIYLGHWNDGVV